MRETERTREAFRYYCSLGWERSYRRVAEHYAVTLRTVERWGKAFNWVERAARVSADRDEEDLNLRRIVRSALGTFIQWLHQKQSEGKPACASVGELEKLVKLDLLLAGEEKERSGPEQVILRFDPESCAPDGRQSASSPTKDPA